MFRRLATLAVLLMTLSGVIPSALACALPMQGRDCCPDGHPCEPANAPVAVIPAAAPCCVVQPAPSQTMVAVSSSVEHRIDPLPVADPSVALAHDFPSSDLSSSLFGSPHAAAFEPPDQQQIYLRTGRLRL